MIFHHLIKNGPISWCLRIYKISQKPPQKPVLDLVFGGWYKHCQERHKDGFGLQIEIVLFHAFEAENALIFGHFSG
jgi:hypothetical protein